MKYNESSIKNTQNKPEEPWILLIALLMASFLGALDTTIVNIGLHTIKLYFNVSIQNVQLVASVYIIIFSAFLPMGGKLGDKFGYYLIFIFGVIGFFVFSICCALATQFVWLIIFRAVKAFFSAIMLPQVLAIIKFSFKAKRDIGISLYGVSLGAASIGGMILGGYIINLFDWRALFLINIPFCIFILLNTLNKIEFRSVNISSTSNLSIDYFGPIIFMMLVICLIVPVSLSSLNNYENFISFIILIIILLSLFLLNENWQNKTNRDGFIPFYLFKNRKFKFGILSLMAYFIGTSGFNIIIVYYLQDNFNFSQFETGNISSTLGIGFMLGSILSGKLIKYCREKIIIIGCMGVIGTRILIIPLSNSSDLTPVILLSILIGITGISQGFILTPIMNTILKSVTSSKAGIASGVLLTACNLSIALGQATFMMLYGCLTTEFNKFFTLKLLLCLMVLIAILMLILITRMIFEKNYKGESANEN